MLGYCPNCKIKLKEPPFGKRNTNEMLVIMAYRKFIDSKTKIRPIDEAGYCEICNATKDEIEIQKK